MKLKDNTLKKNRYKYREYKERGKYDLMNHMSENPLN